MARPPAYEKIPLAERDGKPLDIHIEPSYTPAALHKLLSGKCIIAAVDDVWWATNSYFLIRAARVMPVFEKYLDPDLLNDHGRNLLGYVEGTQAEERVGGVWDLSGKWLTWSTQEAPNLSSFMSIKPTEGTIVQPLCVGARPTRAYAVGTEGTLLSLFEFEGGKLVAFNDEFLKLVLLGATKLGYGRRLTTVEIRCIDDLKPAAVWARTQDKRGGHRDPHGSGYIEETWVDAEPELLGVLMPVRL